MVDKNTAPGDNAAAIDPSTINVDAHPGVFQPKRSKTKHEGLLAPSYVVLYIDALDDPLFYKIEGQLVLGRFVGDQKFTLPLLDLNPFRGMVLGVSRLHARLQWDSGTLYFEDLASTNGSYINEVRVAPHLPQRLEPGDVIRLGRLPIEVYFPKEPDTQQPVEPPASKPVTVQSGEKTTFISQTSVPSTSELSRFDPSKMSSSQKSSEPPVTQNATELLKQIVLSGNLELRLEEHPNAASRVMIEIALSDETTIAALRKLIDVQQKSTNSEITATINFDPRQD